MNSEVMQLFDAAILWCLREIPGQEPGHAHVLAETASTLIGSRVWLASQSQ